MILTTLNKRAGVDDWLKPMTNRLCDGDYVALILEYNEGFIFDEEHARSLSGKRWIVFEMGEYGIDHSYRNTYLPAIRSDSHRPVCNVEERYKLDEFLRGQKIAMCFKREFTQNIAEMIDQGKVHYKVAPVEIFFDNIPPIPDADRDEYISRVGLVFHLFGNSHEDRKFLAGDMMKASGPREQTITVPPCGAG